MKTRVAKIQNQKRGKSVIQWKDIAEIGKIKWIGYLEKPRSLLCCFANSAYVSVCMYVIFTLAGVHWEIPAQGFT